MLYLILLIFFVLFIIWVYNKLVKLENQVEEGLSGIDVQLKRRYDLIPNLVEAVRGYQIYERETLERVTLLRTQSQQIEEIPKKAPLEGELSKIIKNLFILAENYPELKAGEQFLNLQKNLVEVEDALQNARRYYNGAVRIYNTFYQSFPINLIAPLFGFKKKDFFDAPEWEEKSPEARV
ncbi:MAG: LemA family protein [Thermoanaerobaculia bacterium]